MTQDRFESARSLSTYRVNWLILIQSDKQDLYTFNKTCDRFSRNCTPLCHVIFKLTKRRTQERRMKKKNKGTWHHFCELIIVDFCLSSSPLFFVKCFQFNHFWCFSPSFSQQHMVNWVNFISINCISFNFLLTTTHVSMPFSRRELTITWRSPINNIVNS
jgi:hypothetical protein